jgi:hypothetical protein
MLKFDKSLLSAEEHKMCAELDEKNMKETITDEELKELLGLYAKTKSKDTSALNTPPEYNRGFTDGYGAGYKAALEGYQHHLEVARNPPPVIINCAENKKCPCKKEDGNESLESNE